MTIIAGISWNFNNKAETFYRKECLPYSTLKDLHNTLVSRNILNNKINNFGRSSDTSKLFSLLTGLALDDTKHSYLEIKKESIGLISCNRQGVLEDNIKYYKDYVLSGKKMGRGNLFVYTLPTSPLGESAIAYQLKGPVLFMSFLNNQIKNLLDHTNILIKSNNAEGFITIFSDSKGTVCFVIVSEDEKKQSNMNIPLEKFISCIQEKSDTVSLIKALKKYK